MTILAPTWQLSNYFSDPVMRDSHLNSQFTHASLNVNFQPLQCRRNIILSCILKTTCDWNHLEATQRISKEQSQPTSNFFGSDEPNPKILGCNSFSWCFKFRVITEYLYHQEIEVSLTLVEICEISKNVSFHWKVRGPRNKREKKEYCLKGFWHLPPTEMNTC